MILHLCVCTENNRDSEVSQNWKWCAKLYLFKNDGHMKLCKKEILYYKYKGKIYFDVGHTKSNNKINLSTLITTRYNIMSDTDSYFWQLNIMLLRILLFFATEYFLFLLFYIVYITRQTYLVNLLTKSKLLKYLNNLPKSCRISFG